MGEVTAPGWLAGSAAAPAGEVADAAGAGAAGATGAAVATGAGAAATAAYFDTFTFRLSCSPYSRLTESSASSLRFRRSASASMKATSLSCVGFVIDILDRSCPVARLGPRTLARPCLYAFGGGEESATFPQAFPARRSGARWRRKNLSIDKKMIRWQPSVNERTKGRPR